MAGSEAEERIRAAAVALLRDRYPAGRIIHELVLQEGSVRIDVACVTEDLLVVAEVKSERDVLDRLGRQVEAAERSCDGVIVCTVARHADEILRLGARQTREVVRLGGGAYTYALNPDFDHRLERVDVLVEGDDGALTCRWGWAGPREPALLSASRRLRLLWAEELRRVALEARIGVGARAPRDTCIRLCAEMMTGRDVRRAVCAALRRRHFPRADEPVG